MESKIEDVYFERVYDGIVLYDIKSVREVLISYIDGNLKPGEDWHKEDVDDSKNTKDREADGWRKIFNTYDEKIRVLKIRLEEMVSDLINCGRGKIEGDHDVSGTPFYKVNAHTQKVKDYYVLHFSTAGGYDTDAHLSTKLNARRVLKAIRIKYLLPTENNKEISFDLDSVLKNIAHLFVNNPIIDKNEGFEFRGLSRIPIYINEAHYFIDINFIGPKVCSYNQQKMSLAVDNDIPIYLMLTLTPIEIYYRKSLFSDIDMPDFRPIFGIYCEEEVQKVISSARQIDALIQNS